MRETVSIGECMIELARRADGAFDLRVGGDTFNTAVYFARLGGTVTYMTAVGEDPYSNMIIEACRGEGVGTETIVIANGRRPGLYLIETNAGERSFWYWRDNSPARDLFDIAWRDELGDRILAAGQVYLSGVTLSLYSEQGLSRLAGLLSRAKEGGATVVIDSNFRPVGWRHEIARARRVYEQFWRLTDIALPSFDDEQALWGDTDPSQTMARLASFGVGETCLKMAARGAIVADGEACRAVPPAHEIQARDTTAAGDSFSAAYLAARLTGCDAFEAARQGNALAGVVIQHPGAIAPRSAMTQFKP